ncbi:hypothetical protein V496_07488 [Pseudogymnoascus sp. VKM F-4515 (FW-2607)]|nr:hypothetical protein V496_07488 [Pseudogymnoascus sp. VKM F-4515 (FW-2607)]
MPGTNEAGRGDWHLWHETWAGHKLKYLVTITTTEGIRASEEMLTKPGLEAQESLKRGVLPSGNWDIRLL